MGFSVASAGTTGRASIPLAWFPWNSTFHKEHLWRCTIGTVHKLNSTGDHNLTNLMFDVVEVALSSVKALISETIVFKERKCARAMHLPCPVLTVTLTSSPSKHPPILTEAS